MGAGRKELREFWGDCGGVGGYFSGGGGEGGKGELGGFFWWKGKVGKNVCELRGSMGGGSGCQFLAF